MIQDISRKREEGFTLIELLIAIVVVGILAAVVIVGINGLTTTGNTAACKTSLDAAQAAAAVHFATPQGADGDQHFYPTDLQSMTETTPQELVAPTPLTWSGRNAYTHSGWTLTMSYPVAGGPPAFKCT